MPDNNIIDILIRFGLDKGKAQEAAAELKKLGETGTKAEKDVAAETEKLNVKQGEKKKLLRELAREVPALASAWKLVLSPVAVGIGSLIGMMGMFRRTIQETSQAMEDLDSGGRSKEQIAEIAKSFDAARSAAAQFREELLSARSGDSPANRKIAEMRAANKAADEQEDKRLREREATEEQVDAVREMRKRRDLELKRVSAELLADESRQMEQQAKVQEDALAKATAQQANKKQQLEADVAEKAKLDTFIESAVQNKGFWGPMGTWIGTDSDYFQGLLRRQSGLSSSIKKQRGDIQMADLFTLPQMASETAFAKSAAVGAAKGAATATLESGVDAQFLSTPSFDLVASAAAGADAIRGGGRATRAQSKDFNELVRLLGLKDQKIQTMLEIVSSFNDTQDAMIQVLSQLSSEANRTALAAASAKRRTQ